jgi:PKD repeat protein
MKRFYHLLCLSMCLLTAYMAQAQVTLPTLGAAPLQTACSGTVLDSGGTDDYQDGVNSTVTISPNAESVSVSFTEFALESCCDHVKIFDGDNIGAPLIADLGSTLPGTNVYTSTGSSITIQFTTDGSVTFSGFVMNWEVEGAGLDATFLPSDTNPPANVPVLFMSNASCVDYLWNFGDEITSTESSPTHSYAAPGTYNVTLLITNDVGETDTYSTQVVVQDFGDISATPGAFSGTLPANGDSIVAPLTITNNGDGPLIFSIGGGALQSEKGLNVLALTNTASTEYAKAITAINTVFTDYELTEAQPDSPAELEALLPSADIIFIPEQTTAVDVALFASFADLLNGFVEAGGTVFFTGTNDSEYVFATELFSGTHVDGAGGTTVNPLTILLPEDPLMDNIVAPYQTQANTFTYDFSNSDIVRVVESEDGKDVVAYRNIGDGKAIFIGHDYKFSQFANMKNVIANAIKQASGDIAWLYLSAISGTLAPGESITIDVELNANYVCGGAYEQDLVIYSNDPDQPEIVIPASLEILGTPSYAAAPNSFDFGELQQFDTETQTLVINNPGTYELYVDITSSNSGYIVEPATFTVPGCNGTQAVSVTFAPQLVQLYTGTLSIETNVAPFPYTIPLTGNSVGAPVTTVTPSPIEVSVMTGETTTQDITISNTGIGPLTYNIDTADFDAQMNVVIFNHASVSATEITDISNQLNAQFPGQITSTPVTATTAAQLAASLATADMFVVPSFWNTEAWDLIGDFANVLQTFTNNGGTVLFFGTSNFTVPPAVQSGLFSSGTVAFNNGNAIDITDPNHPLMSGLTGGFESANFYPLLLDGFNGTNVLTQEITSTSFSSILAINEIGAGRAIYYGIDGLGFAEPSEITVFNNIIGWTKNTQLAAWLDLEGTVTDGYIASNTSGTLTATFNSGSLLGGVYTTEIVLTTNDPVQPTITIPVVMTVIGVPQISVDAISLDYGPLVIGNVETQTITITNPGTDFLIISSITTGNAAYTTSASTLTIPPFGALQLDVTFTPTAIQNYNSFLTLSSNAGNIPITLTGQGQGAPISSATPDEIEVSLVQGETSTQSITISNAAAAAGALQWEVNGQGAPQVLALRYGANDFNFTNMLTYLNTYAPSVEITEFDDNDPQALEDALEGKDVFLIPRLEWTTGNINTLSTFATILAEFAASGGSILIVGNDCGECITATGLLAGTYQGGLWGGTPMDIVDENHPITANIPNPYTPFSNVNVYNFTNPGFVTLAEADLGTCIGYRNIGDGKVVYWGFNFDTPNDVTMGQSLGSTMGYISGELPEWLTISPFSGNTAAGQNGTITLNFDSAGMATGVYTYTVIIYTNDPLNPVYVIPVTMNVIAMPEAAVTASTTVGCGTGTIQFFDQTANVATSWTWDFGDGTFSSVQNPIHTYATDGTYTVTLEACNALGCDEIVLTDYITIDLSCAFVVLPASGELSSTECNGALQDHGGDANYSGSAFTIFTIDVSNSSSQGIVLSFADNFNIGTDGIYVYEGTEVGGIPFASFTGNVAPAPLTMETNVVSILWQANNFNLPGFTLNWQCLVPTVAPAPNFTYAVGEACEGEVIFTDQSENYPGSYTWNFGDGTTSNEADPTHYYEQSGTYNVTLTACNDIGCNDIVLPVTIDNVFEVTPNIPACVVMTGATVSVLLNGQTAGATYYQWNYGNGQPGNQGANAFTAVAIYSAPGTYTITLVVTSSTGCQRTITRTIIIMPVGQTCGVSTDNPVLEAKVVVAPNPSNGRFNLAYGFTGQQNVNLRVFDAVGRELISRNAQASNGYQTEIDLSNYAKGLYFVLLSTAEGTVTKRITIQ